MYRQYSHGNSRRFGGGSHNGQSRGQRMVKRLDPSLFVKAATFETEEVYRPKNNFWDLKIDIL